MTEGEPCLNCIRRERDPEMIIRRIPYEELQPNAAQKAERRELRDLDRRIHEPVTLSTTAETEVQGNRDSKPKRKTIRRALWKDKLQGSWRRPKK